MKVKVLVTQSCPTLGDPMVCSPPGSSVRGILQARVLEWAREELSCDKSGHRSENMRVRRRSQHVAKGTGPTSWFSHSSQIQTPQRQGHTLAF